jgi:ABC-type glycerol-3-phosphate transport system permease component
MSEQLTTCLIAVAANLIAMLLIYAAMSHALARLAWRQRGAFIVIVLVLITQVFWIAPAFLIIDARSSSHASSYALWFGNWLVTGFSLVLLWKAAKRIPVALEEAARLDGLGGFATWRQAVFPFVRGELAIIAMFTVMATLLPCWGLINQSDAANIITIADRLADPGQRIARMLAGSLAGSVPLIAVFLAAKRRA